MSASASVRIARQGYERDGGSAYERIGVFSARERAAAAIDARRGRPDGFVTVHG